MATLYAYEDFPYPVVEHLRTLGPDVLTAQEDGRAGQISPTRTFWRGRRRWVVRS